MFSDDSRLLGHDAVLLGEWFLTFQTNVASHLKESEGLLLGYLDPIKGRHLYKYFIFLYCV
jgi:hypothetical protein